MDTYEVNTRQYKRFIICAMAMTIAAGILTGIFAAIRPVPDSGSLPFWLTMFTASTIAIAGAVTARVTACTEEDYWSLLLVIGVLHAVISAIVGGCIHSGTSSTGVHTIIWVTYAIIFVALLVSWLMVYLTDIADK